MPAYKDEKRGTWYYKGKAKNSLGQWKDYQKRGFTTKKEALKAEKEFLDNKIFGYTTTVDEVFENYLKSIKDNQSINTVRRKVYSYNNHIKTVFGNKKISSINRANIIAFRDELSTKVANNSANSILSVFKSIFKYAIYEMNLDIQDPFKNVSFLKINDKEYNIWSPQEFNEFISFVDNDLYYLAFHLLYNTGMRIGELLALQWKDYNNGFINIKKSVSKKEIHTPKTKNSYRKIKIDNKSIELLNNIYQHKEDDDFNDDFFIFGNQQPPAEYPIRRAFEKYLKLSKVKRIRLHDFRHSHASFLINNNVPVVAIAQRLGDKQTTILNVYAHFFDTTNDLIMELLNNQ